MDCRLSVSSRRPERQFAGGQGRALPGYGGLCIEREEHRGVPAMSHKHVTAARFCPMFKGGARLLLFILCDRAGSGSRFKNGKKSVFGWTSKLSDKTLMRSLNC